VGWKLDLKKATDTLTLDSIRALIAGKAPVEAGRDMDEGEFELF
jgi:hypothetical protein